MKGIRSTTHKIILGYDYSYEGTFVSEEEFVYDSLSNPELLRLLKSTNIKRLHLINGNDMAFEQPDEEYIKVVIANKKENENGHKEWT